MLGANPLFQNLFANGDGSSVEIDYIVGVGMAKQVVRLSRESEPNHRRFQLGTGRTGYKV